MKTKISTFFAIAAIVLSVQNVHAKIRRLGYPGQPIGGVDYSSLQKAIDSSVVKDTIYVFPGTWGAANVTKRLVFAGYGAMMGDTALQVRLGVQSLQLDLFPGSDSTIMEGLDNLTVSKSNGAGPVNNIIIRRCHCIVIWFHEAVLNNWVISQCVIDNMGYFTGGGLVNVLVSNNIIYRVVFNQCAQVCCYAWSYIGMSSGSGIFVNNIFLAKEATVTSEDLPAGAHNFNNGQFIMQNNIFADTAIYGAGSLTWANNISTKADIPLINLDGSATKNKQNVSPSSLFVGYPIQGTKSDDGRYALSTASPARAAGIGGIDCGILGGAAPYRLSCIPALPSFFRLSAPSTTATSNPYIITFSVRSNN